MPLSENERVNDTAKVLVDTFRAVFHTPETDRPAHSRGQFVNGTFTPSTAGPSFSSAKIFSQPSTPIIARFSSSTGIPNIEDNNASANPRGFAIRFVLSADGHKHYDVIMHSANGFLVRTGEDLLAFFQANKDGTTAEFFEAHPESKEFASKTPGFPQSFATEQYFGVNAFKFVNAEGKETWIRYRAVPADGKVAHYSPAEIDGKGGSYLYDELNTRLHQPSESIKFKLLAQIAEPQDVLDDATNVWPESRVTVELGTINIDEIWNASGDDEREQKRVIFDPVPRQIEGVEAGTDPLIDMRAAVYLISGKKRRAAAGVA